MSRLSLPAVVSANDLLAGHVVYLDREGGFSRDIARAAIARSEAEARALMSQADRPLQVVGPDLVAVEIGPDGIPRPRHVREAIRERGPTHRPDLDRHRRETLQDA